MLITKISDIPHWLVVHTIHQRDGIVVSEDKAVDIPGHFETVPQLQEQRTGRNSWSCENIANFLDPQLTDLKCLDARFSRIVM